MIKQESEKKGFELPEQLFGLDKDGFDQGEFVREFGAFFAPPKIDDESSGNTTSDNTNDLEIESLLSSFRAPESQLIPQPDSASDYQRALDILKGLKFGGFSLKEETQKPSQKQPPPTLFLPPESTMWNPETDYTQDTSLPYRMRVTGLPEYSRVETQIKVDLNIHPRPAGHLVHVSSDLIAKRKLCLKEGLEGVPEHIRRQMVYLDCYVVADSEDSLPCFKSCNICQKCIKRELKRALRRKNGLLEDGLNWVDVIPKKAIIFNLKEVVAVPESPDAILGSCGRVDLSARIVCYCRHHHAPHGFRLLFVLRDYSGAIVGRTFLAPIMIMDRKKTMEVPKRRSVDVNPLTPPLLDDESSDGKLAKRMRTSSGAVAVRRVDTGALPLSDSAALSYTGKLPTDSSMMPSFSGVLPKSVPAYAPAIQKVIPAEGPIRGGIEITLLGVNFRPGLQVKFGGTNALATHCWSESTIVTFLPPAASPGQVLVSFESEEGRADNSSVFTYTDDTDRQMIELALQIVGLKMNGKLEDARHIARRIVGTDLFDKAGGSSEATDGNYKQNLAFGASSEEEELLKLMNVCDLPESPLPNWQVCNREKQTMLHLACLKGFQRVVSALVTRGARVDCKDVNGYTPLHFAAMGGHTKVASILFKARANGALKTNGGLTAADLAGNLQIEALLREHLDDDLEGLASSGYGVLRSESMSLLLSFEEDGLRYHVSRMVERGEIADQRGKEREEVNTEFVDESDNADDEGDDGDSELPKYDDLYPGGKDVKSKTVEESEAPSEEAQLETEAESEESRTFNYYMYLTEKNKGAKFRNDKMLLFFWVPMLILFALVYVYSQFSGIAVLNERAEETVNYIREALYQFMIGKQRMETLINRQLGLESG